MSACISRKLLGLTRAGKHVQIISSFPFSWHHDGVVVFFFLLETLDIHFPPNFPEIWSNTKPKGSVFVNNLKFMLDKGSGWQHHLGHCNLMMLAPAHSPEVWDLPIQASHPCSTKGAAVSAGTYSEKRGLLLSWHWWGGPRYFLGAMQEAESCAGTDVEGSPWEPMTCLNSFCNLNWELRFAIWIEKFQSF